MSYLSAQIVFWLLSRMVTRVINFSIPTSFSLPKTELKRLFETRRIIILINYFYSSSICSVTLHGAVRINDELQNTRPKVSPVSPLHGMMNSSGKSTVNTRQDRPMISSAKLEKEKTTNNQCLKKFDYRLIYNYFFEIPLCKKECKEKVKFVTFLNGEMLSVVYDCVKN